jgi:hypothetical protein
MTTRLIFLAAALLCWAAPAAGQTIKSLGFNTTNGQVVYTGTNALTFTNALSFGTNAASTTRTNLSLGSTWLTNTNVTNFRTAIGLGVSSSVEFSNVYASALTEVRTLFVNDSTNQVRVQFEEPANAKTFVRNLTGSTNTGHPFSGLFHFVDPEVGNTTYQVVVSNGIILSIDEI